MASRKPQVVLLTNSHFYVDSSKTLTITTPNPTVILFELPQDANCNNFKQYFNMLVTSENRVKFGILDIEQYSDVIDMSRTTTTPIRTAPILVLYVNGKPILTFKPNSDISVMRNSITAGFQHAQQNAQKLKAKSGSTASQNLYGGKTQGEALYKPDIGEPPSMKGYIKGAGNTPLDMSDNDERLLVPAGYTAYNEPWKIYTERN
jgi:hypothetical protein